MEEVWKDIENYEGLYQVSNLGNVKRLKGKGCAYERLIARNINKYGYVYRTLHNNGIAIKYKEHRLVANAFIDNKYKKETVNHINGIKTDNRVENLEWSTILENKQHAINTGLTNTKGIKNHFCKLTEEQVLEIREIGFSQTRISLSKKYGVSSSNIIRIIKKEMWKHI